MKLNYLLLFGFLLLSACTGLPPAIENAPAEKLSYGEVNLDINRYQDAPVRWGGVIIDVENQAQSSLMQVVFYPLGFDGRPQLYKLGEGRFVIKSPEFLDPAVYTKNKEVTVAGTITGNIERRVGKRVVRVPLVSATAIHLWPPYVNNYNPYYYNPYPAFPRPLYGPAFYRW
jgi:outer membrane lipoprotein